MKNKKATSRKVASTASKVLKNPKSAHRVRQLAGSALSQVNNPNKTSSRMETLASKVLNDPRSTTLAKQLAGSVLAQGVSE